MPGGPLDGSLDAARPAPTGAASSAWPPAAPARRSIRVKSGRRQGCHRLLGHLDRPSGIRKRGRNAGDKRSATDPGPFLVGEILLGRHGFLLERGHQPREGAVSPRSSEDSSSLDDGDGHRLLQACRLHRTAFAWSRLGASGHRDGRRTVCVNGPSRRLLWRSCLGWPYPLPGLSCTRLAFDDAIGVAVVAFTMVLRARTVGR